MKKYKEALKYTGIAGKMAFTMLGGVYIGFWLDRWWDTEPVFLIICLIVFVPFAIYSVIKDILKG